MKPVDERVMEGDGQKELLKEAFWQKYKAHGCFKSGYMGDENHKKRVAMVYKNMLDCDRQI